MNTIIIDRSNLDEIVAIFPKGHKDYPDGRKQTRLEMLQEDRCPRADIVLLNGRTKQFALYVTETGYTGDTWILEILSESEFNEVCGIAHKMRMNALTHECCKKYIC